MTKTFVSSAVRTVLVKSVSLATSSTQLQISAKLVLKGATSVQMRPAVFCAIRQSILDRDPSEASALVIRPKAGIKMMRIHLIVNA